MCVRTYTLYIFFSVAFLTTNFGSTVSIDGRALLEGLSRKHQTNCCHFCQRQRGLGRSYNNAIKNLTISWSRTRIRGDFHILYPFSPPHILKRAQRRENKGKGENGTNHSNGSFQWRRRCVRLRASRLRSALHQRINSPEFFLSFLSHAADNAVASSPPILIIMSSIQLLGTIYLKAKGKFHRGSCFDKSLFVCVRNLVIVSLSIPRSRAIGSRVCLPNFSLILLQVRDVSLVVSRSSREKTRKCV